MHDSPPSPPDARLLLAPNCPHCPSVLEALTTMIKAGDIGRLEVINLALRPDLAEGVRSVPWVRIGEFELPGRHTLAELRDWAERAVSGQRSSGDLQTLLEQRELERVTTMLQTRPERLADLLQLAADPDTPIQVRIGVGAVLEEIGEALLGAHFDQLATMTQHPHPAIRADAAHYLGLSGDPRTLPLLRRLRDDDDPSVREIAMDSLQLLHDRLADPGDTVTGHEGDS
jgi:hypothetical protein